MANKWSVPDIPDMAGKTAVITGGNSDLGHKTALELARRGAEVTITCRNADKGEAAVENIKREAPDADVSFGQMELVNFASISGFAEQFLAENSRLDILINNAGIVIHPKHQLTADDQELQMQVNHLGHFALTGGLFPLLKATDRARVISLNTMSAMHNRGKIDFDDFNWSKRKYDPMQSYIDSRVAQLLFSFKLNSIFESAGATSMAIGMQPGLVATRGQQDSAGGWLANLLRASVDKGCATHLQVATDPSVQANQFWQPRFAVRGAPAPQPFKDAVRQQSVADRLWALSEQITGVNFP